MYDGYIIAYDNIEIEVEDDEHLQKVLSMLKTDSKVEVFPRSISFIR